MLKEKICHDEIKRLIIFESSKKFAFHFCKYR